MKINSISPQEHSYLQIICDIAKPPKKFYLIGKLPDKRIPTVAIVGTRKPSAYGKEVTYALSASLARRGVVVMSGLALGVDAIAHQAALDAGGATIAILANGVDSVYPAANRQLAQSIVEHGGAIMSEYEPGTPARDYQFLARNRLVSGLADVLIVTEAAQRSGTLATVAHALEQGIDIYAVPGNITSPLSAGTNAIIAQGATPIVDIDAFVDQLLGNETGEQPGLPLGMNDAESSILTLIYNGVRSGEELQSQSGLDPREFAQTITTLEITGRIRALGANTWTLG